MRKKLKLIFPVFAEMFFDHLLTKILKNLSKVRSSFAVCGASDFSPELLSSDLIKTAEPSEINSSKAKSPVLLSNTFEHFEFTRSKSLF